MRKLLLTLTTLVLITFPVLTALAIEPETGSPPKDSAAEKGITQETTPASREIGTSPAPALPVKKVQNIKIGFIDMAKIASDSSPGKAVYAEVKTKMEKYQKQVKSKERQLQKQKADIEAQMPSLAPIQRSAKAKEFQKKLESFQSFLQNAEKDVRAREAELLKKLYESVAKSASDYGKANGFAAIVMNKELLFTGSNVEIKDLTAEIIKLIDGSQEEKTKP